MKLNINKINLIKAERGLNNLEISNLTNISPAWLSTVFNRGYASTQIINKLAKGLDLDVSEIIILDE